jgi:hypothetical protein
MAPGREYNSKEHGMPMVCMCKSLLSFLAISDDKRVCASADYDQRHHAQYDARGWLLCYRSAILDRLDEGECSSCQNCDPAPCGL